MKHPHTKFLGFRINSYQMDNTKIWITQKRITQALKTHSSVQPTLSHDTHRRFLRGKALLNCVAEQLILLLYFKLHQNQALLVCGSIILLLVVYCTPCFKLDTLPSICVLLIHLRQAATTTTTTGQCMLTQLPVISMVEVAH